MIIKLNNIIKKLEARWFMSSMATGAMGIFTSLIAKHLNLSYLKLFSIGLIFLSILIFLVSIVLYILRIIFHLEAVATDAKHPIASNFFAGISISSAIISTAISNVLIPMKIVGENIGPIYSLGFYLFGMITGLVFLFMTTSVLITSSETKSIHALGIWLLPPVGVFVSIFSGNFLAKFFPTIGPMILMLHLFVFGVAFFIYILTLGLIFYRVRFHPLPPAEMAPSFLIPLSPVGVSIIALYSLAAGLKNIADFSVIGNLISSLLLLYIPIMVGFGIFCAISTVLVMWHYIKTKGIPFSLGFWAFVFPVDALGIGIFLSSKLEIFSFLSYLAIFIWGISSLLWIFVFYRTIIGIITGSIFERPKTINN